MSRLRNPESCCELSCRATGFAQAIGTLPCRAARLIGTAALIVALFAPTPVRAAGEPFTLPIGARPSATERFVDGLRSRGLFDLAETYCRQRLQSDQTPETERAEIALELARTIAAHAIDAPAANRAPLWRQAETVIDEFTQAHPRDPQALALALQRALVSLAAGELSRQEAEVGGQATAPLDPARTALRDAVAQLKQLDERVTLELQRLSRSPRGEPGGWTAAQLASLATNLRFQLARSYRNQALCYPPESPDRLNSLTQALSQLKSLAELPPETSLAWDSRVDQIVCLRLLRDISTAERALAAALQERPPPDVRRRLEAESIRLALDFGEIDRALDAVGPFQPRAEDGPELNLAKLEAYVAGWRSAARGAAAPDDRWRRAALDQARLIEQAFGAYWMRRAETLIASTITQTPGGENFDTQLRAAESYFRGGRLDEALAVYDRAAQLARNAGDVDRAFAAALTAATIEHERSHWREAAARYAALATAAPERPKAAEAHLMAIYDAAQLAQAATGAARPAAMQLYERLLLDHLRLWPTSPTCGQAAYWLGQARESDRQYEAAIEAYRAVPPGHPQFVAAIDATARALRGRLAERRSAESPDPQLAGDGARYFASLRQPPPKQSPAPWADVRRRAALAAAEFYLEAGADGPSQSVALLEESLRETPPPDAAWQDAARALLIPGLAAIGRPEDARRELAALVSTSPQALVELAESLLRRATASEAEPRAAIARLAEQALTAAAPARDKLTASEQRRFDLTLARAIADGGDYDRGLSLLAKLAGDQPEDGALQEALAELLAAGKTEQRKQALRKWREVQQKSRPGTPRWFRASYGLARTQYLLGNKVAAAAAVRLVAQAYPELGGPEQRARFERLLADSQR